MNTRGFTLLEVLVASTIMAVAVGTLMSALSTSVRNASRATESDRAAVMGKRVMDQLLLDPMLMPGAQPQASWNIRETGVEGGWRARVEPFEAASNPALGGMMDRIVMEVWWTSGSTRRTFALEAYRRVARRPLP